MITFKIFFFSLFCAFSYPLSQNSSHLGASRVEDADTGFGDSTVCGADGTVYVTTGKSGDEAARVTAVGAGGNVKWEALADGNIAGSAAVDNEGYIYYNDMETGKLVKLSPDGTRVAEIQLAEDMRSSPAISSDGTIYCTGVKGGLPTVFAVKGSATGHADSWSQLGGNPSRTCTLNR